MDMMTEKQQNIWKWTGRVLVLIGGLGGILAAAQQLPAWFQNYAALAVALIAFGARWVEQQLPPVKKAILKPPMSSVVAIVGLLGVVALSGCPTPYKAAMGTTAGVMRATQSASSGLAAGSKAEMDAGGDKDVICKRLKTYRDNVRPAARSGVAASLAAIRIAREAGKKDVDIMAILKPAACGLVLGLREWGHKLPDKGKSILGYLDLFAGMTCDKPASNAGAIIAAILPAAVDLVKWIIEIIGASSDKLEKEIAAWLAAPAADAVDALIAAECG